MQSKELLVTALKQSSFLVMPLLEDLKTAPLVQPTPKGGNHAHWILGHLLVSEAQFGTMRCGTENQYEHLKPLFGGGSKVDPEAKDYPPYEELLAMLSRARNESLQWLEGIENGDLDQRCKVVPPGFELFFGTWANSLLMQGMHWMNHRGQLADCRRAAGREKLMV